MESFSVRLDGFEFAPPAFERQETVRGKLLKRLSGPDRKDCYLVELAHAVLCWTGFRPRSIKHVVIAPRWPGAELAPHSEGVPVDLSLVLDPAVAGSDSFQAGQVQYAAVARFTGDSP